MDGLKGYTVDVTVVLHSACILYHSSLHDQMNKLSISCGQVQCCLAT